MILMAKGARAPSHCDDTQAGDFGFKAFSVCDRM